ncbi:unnamed protein product [Caretta caretta]
MEWSCMAPATSCHCHFTYGVPRQTECLCEHQEKHTQKWLLRLFRGLLLECEYVQKRAFLKGMNTSKGYENPPLKFSRKLKICVRYSNILQ